MRLGILTFHAQLNYGGVLQCWAMQKVLRSLGHDPVVIDRRLGGRSYRRIRDVFKGWSWKGFVWFLAFACRKHPDALRQLRHVNTARFIRRHYTLSPYSFDAWQEAPRDLGVDALVVGSDQVWNAKFQDPAFYLLEGAPAVPAIGYAVSLGMTEIPPRFTEAYRRAATRFTALGVRESASVPMLRPLGFAPVHVADPTLLADFSEIPVTEKGGLFVYIIGEEALTDAVVSAIGDFAARQNCSAHVYFQHPDFFRASTARVRFHYAAGPDAFLSALAAAEWVISDSFHALMFSTIFGKNVRLVKPEQPGRLAMFERISEFVARYVKGRCIASSFGEGLDSLVSDPVVTYNRSELATFVNASRAWLEEAISQARADA